MNLYLLPKDIQEHIIFLTTNPLNDLRSINKDFSIRCQIIKIISNANYPNLTDKGLKTLVNLSFIMLIDDKLISNKLITNDGIKGLINLTSLMLCCNILITDDGLKGLINLASLDLRYNDIITDDGIKELINLSSLKLSLIHI